MRIPIVDAGREISHLEVEIAAAEAGADSRASILYLHGFGSSRSGEKADFFRSRAVAAGLGFWSFDFQGHGDSGGGMRGLSLSRNLADVALVRARMSASGVERVILLGSSMGGLTGLWHSVRDPDGVEAGLYIAPALGLEKAFRRWAGEDGLVRWERDGVFEITNELGTWELGWGFVEDLRRYPSRELAAALRTPSLLLQGRLDDRVAWRDVAELATRCRGRGVEMHLFDDGDHRLVDRKDELWRLMIAFLRARGLADPS